MIWDELTDILDIWLALLYATLIIVGAYIYQQRKVKSNDIYRFYTPALVVKIAGGIVFGLIYQFYYGGGDTIYYFKGAKVLQELFVDSPLLYFKALFQTAGSDDIELNMYTERIPFFQNSEGYLMAKLTSLICILSFGRYYPATILIAFMAFQGIWVFFKFFIRTDIDRSGYMPYFILFIPSVVFWGSGILKDTICMIALAYLTMGMAALVDKSFRNSLIIQVLSISFSTYLLVQLKAYIIISFVPCFLYWYYTRTRNKINSPILKIILPPIIFITLTGFSFYAVNVIMESSTFYNLDKIESRVEGFQNWHSYLSERDGQFGYSLGEVELTPRGILTKLLPAINVGLFRPYVWESRSIVQILSSFENTVLLLLTIYVVFKRRLKIFENINSRFFLAFSLVFAFVVGFTSYNFGALVRYKIPLLPFYGAFLAISLAEIKSLAKGRA